MHSHARLLRSILCSFAIFIIAGVSGIRPGIAQTFTQQTGANNPFDGEDVGDNSTPVFVDIDNDGDYDAFIGKNDGTVNYYQNTGSASSPSFTESVQEDLIHLMEKI